MLKIKVKLEKCSNQSIYHAEHVRDIFFNKLPPQSLQFGLMRHGVLKEYMIEPTSNVILIDLKVSDYVAAISESIIVRLNAVEKIKDINKEKFVNFRPGPIVHGIVSILVGLEEKNVIVVGTHSDVKRLENAKEIGVNHTIISDNFITKQLFSFRTDMMMLLIVQGYYTRIID